MANSQEPLLEVRDLVKHFPVRHERNRWVHAVNGVSLDVFPGETLGLIGESGSGKTTVGRCIVGLAKPTSGAIRLRGQDLHRLSGREIRSVRSRIQMVFQDPRDSLNPRMKVGQIIEEPLLFFTGASNKERAERVEAILEQVQLDRTILSERPRPLPGGVQQRVAIARALASSPDLVILDEPTSELDVSVRAEIVRLLKRLQQDLGIAYLFISHDLTAVKELSRRIAIMYLGEVVESTGVIEMFHEQLHPYSKALLASVLFPDPERPYSSAELSGEIPSPVDLPTGCFLHPRCPYALSRCVAEHPELANQFGRAVRCLRAADIRSGVAVSIGTAAGAREAINRALSDNPSVAPSPP